MNWGVNLTFYSAHLMGTYHGRRSKAMDRDDELLLKIERQIRSNAFKEETYAYSFKDRQGAPDTLKALTHVYILDRVIKKSGIRYRRMYECRHTFASWALAAGETPEWVARTLGHVDTSMVYKTYGRYIPNLTRRDGSAFEKLYSESTSKSLDTNRHNLGHNGLKSCPWSNLIN